MPAFNVNLYFSGSVEEQTERYLIQKDAFRLFTFAYPKELFAYLDIADTAGVRCRIMVDSGAFTSWSVGKPIRLEDLLRYDDDVLHRYGERHDFIFIALDVIPGERNRRATAEDIATAVKQSYSNFVAMNSHLTDHYVIPVYHSGEEVSLRNAYLQQTDYVALSMDQSMAERNRVAWAQRSYVSGFKFHGLAATGNKMITQVPWLSVDSSSWVTVAAMGNVLWPVGNEFRFIAVSDTSPSRHTAGYHIDNLTAIERVAVQRIIRERGYDPDALRQSYTLRWQWNIDMWCDPPWRTAAAAQPMDLFTGC